MFFPNWKGYLYDLLERWRIFKRINLRKRVPGFNIKPGDFFIIKNCLIKFGKGGELRKKRAFIYDAFVKVVEENQSRVLSSEFKLAVRLSKIKKLKLENLIMEMSELKKFGKEVGLGFSDMKGLDEDELIMSIVQKVDPKKQKYSAEFVKWYEDLDEDVYFNDVEDKKKKEKDSSKKKDDDDEEVEFDKDEVVDAIENADKIKELYKLIETFPDVFPEKFMKTKDMEELQEKMMEKLEEMEEEKPKKKEKGSKKKDEEDDEKETLEKGDIKEAIKLIKGEEDIAELRTLCKTYTNFEDIELRGKTSLETLQKKMLAALGVEVEDDEEEKPKKKEKGKKKESSMEDELSELSLLELKKLAKENGIKVPIGTSKEKTIQMILEAAEEGDEKETEIELNPSLVKKMVKEKDIEGLQEAAKAMGITLKALEKRSPKAIGEKLIEALSENGEKSSKKDKGSKKKEKVSAWEKVKEMVAEGEKAKAIIKEVTPILEELGIDEDEAEDKVKVLIEIAKAESE
jgi:hypothetical protein